MGDVWGNSRMILACCCLCCLLRAHSRAGAVGAAEPKSNIGGPRPAGARHSPACTSRTAPWPLHPALPARVCHPERRFLPSSTTGSASGVCTRIGAQTAVATPAPVRCSCAGGCSLVHKSSAVAPPPLATSAGPGGGGGPKKTVFDGAM
eukprot:scaffold4572_cov130-Isochrysis_galbana.AAC.1